MIWTKETLEAEIDKLGPWHYCHGFPFGLTTGSYIKEMFPDKMDRLLANNAFSRPQYPKVLDLGANSGIISMWFANNRNSMVYAVEHGPKYYPQLELAIEVKGYSGRVIPVNRNIAECDFSPGGFDLILFLGTLHHIAKEHYPVIFSACMKALLPSGELVVQTKTEIDVLSLLTAANFIHARKLYTSDFYKRSAWIGLRDPMKI